MIFTIAKCKTAFQFFQAENQSKIKKDLGKGATMGTVMTEISVRWKKFSPADRLQYDQKEEEDLQRYQQECAIADEQATLEQRVRRRKLVVQEGEDISMRGERVRVAQDRAKIVDERRQRKEKIESEMDPEELSRRRIILKQKKVQTLERQRKRIEEEKLIEERHKKLNKEDRRNASKRIDYLLKQSSIFAKLKGNVNVNVKSEIKHSNNKDYTPHHREKDSNRSNIITGATEGEEYEDDEDLSENHTFLSKQPDCIKYGTLKSYQLEALNWMIHLAEKGLNGILADEMGLGKTLESISILAYQYEFQRIQGPHLICVPKSTLSNWMNELSCWCPCLRVIKFHGTREEKQQLANKYFRNDSVVHDGKRPTKTIINEDTGDTVDDNSDNPRAWDVCVTTYEVCNSERQTLSKFAWKYLVIDEAHRLKNEASMFSKAVRTFKTAHRLLLTGTPLQNNLHELWALLNFLLPDIFSSSDQFDEWFDLEIDDEQAKKNMISQLHKILRPFMLRRLKSDVAKGLPSKTETLVMVGMSSMQKKLYKKLLLRDIDSITSSTSKNKTAILNIVMQLRKCCGHPYLFEGIEDRSLDPLGEHLVDNCGKLSMVDKLLKKLKERGSRVLIFTQMTRILDILEDYMVMRKYKYCRIDGNTDYVVREESIEAFNMPHSDKFCFILSTRAGGLGINLQTADTCILYDSDWNPQADLQAQDRCHRLGQKKPVSVYRLVSENTVEEKIVERAQQKLKLDAMVVQQGRLKEKDKVTKEEIMAAVRFGADTVFRSEESTITDEDVDVILARGVVKTKELAAKIHKAEKGDMLDFRMDGGISAQTFDGIDYSDKDLRNQLRLLAADSMGKRERRPPPTNYNPVIQPKKSMIVNNRKIKLPKALRLPRMEDHQFYNRERLLQLSKLEFQALATLKQAGQLPPGEFIEKQKTLLPDELSAEKLDLLEEGFGDWTRSQYFHFVKAASKFGRDDINNIAADMQMPIEQVKAYSEAFWTYGPTELKQDEWERVLANVEKGEMKIAKIRKNTELLKKFISTFDDPMKEMIFANKGTAHFTLEQDRALLCAVDQYGYGNWDKVREELRDEDNLLFQIGVQCMNTDSIAKRCDYRMRQMERELEAREKKIKSITPLNVIAAEIAINGIKEMDTWEDEANKILLNGGDLPSLETLSNDAKEIMKERLNDRNQIADRLREIEIQLRGCRQLGKQTKESILRGDQYVNYSHITLKAGGLHMAVNGHLNGIDGLDLEAYVNKSVLLFPECGECKSCKEYNSRRLCLKRQRVRNKKISEYENKMKKIRSNMKVYMDGAKRKGNTRELHLKTKEKNKKHSNNKSANDQVKSIIFRKKISPPGNPLGNKRMSVPKELLPELCSIIGSRGTRKRMEVINNFVKDHPRVSIRQVTLKFSELTTRHPPGCVPEPEKIKGTGRAFLFFLRPRFYYLLPEKERPENWEKYAKEDDILWEKEKNNKVVKKKKKDKQMSLPVTNTMIPNNYGTDIDSIRISVSDSSIASMSLHLQELSDEDELELENNLDVKKKEKL